MTEEAVMRIYLRHCAKQALKYAEEEARKPKPILLPVEADPLPPSLPVVPRWLH
jgi:hypothetical protein